jgi:ketosteroid isomerase-like protein
MSQANVEIIKRVIDAYNRGDVDAFADLTTPDFEWLTAGIGIIDGVPLYGREGIETYFGDLRDTWEKLRIIADEFRDLGDRVLVLGRVEGRGKGSGVEVDSPLGLIGEFRGGKMSHGRTYLDRAEALQAVGLAG